MNDLKIRKPYETPAIATAEILTEDILLESLEENPTEGEIIRASIGHFSVGKV